MRPEEKDKKEKTKSGVSTLGHRPPLCNRCYMPPPNTPHNVYARTRHLKQGWEGGYLELPHTAISQFKYRSLSPGFTQPFKGPKWMTFF